MSHIRQKFNDYKQELRLIYNNDLQHKRLDISSQSMKELLSKGYFIRKIDSFLFFNEFNQKDLNEFFAEECKCICLADLIFEHDCETSMPTEEYIRLIKYETIRIKLIDELTDMTFLLKEENINKN